MCAPCPYTPPDERVHSTKKRYSRGSVAQPVENERSCLIDAAAEPKSFPPPNGVELYTSGEPQNSQFACPCYLMSPDVLQK